MNGYKKKNGSLRSLMQLELLIQGFCRQKLNEGEDRGSYVFIEIDFNFGVKTKINRKSLQPSIKCLNLRYKQKHLHLTGCHFHRDRKFFSFLRHGLSLSWSSYQTGSTLLKVFD